VGIEALVTVATTQLVAKTSDPFSHIWEDFDRIGGPCTKMSKTESQFLTALTANGSEVCSGLGNVVRVIAGYVRQVAGRTTGTPELLSDWMVSVVKVKYLLDCY
jgi:hypothetical protein